MTHDSMRVLRNSDDEHGSVDCDFGKVVCVCIAIGHMLLQSCVLLQTLPAIVLMGYSSVIYAGLVVVLLLGQRTLSFSIYALALLTSYSDISWTGGSIEETSGNIGDLRLGPLSVAIWYLVLVSAIVMLRKDIWKPIGKSLIHAVLKEMSPLTMVVVFGTIGGLIRVPLGDHRISDVATDLFSMLFVFLFLYGVVGCLPRDRVRWLLKAALYLAILSIAVNLFLGVRVVYGGQWFSPIPDIVNYLPIVVVALFGTQRWLCICFWFVYAAAVFGAGIIAPTGKLIVILVMAAAYLLTSKKNGGLSLKRVLPVIAGLLIVVSSANMVSDILDDLDYKVLAYKYRQVFAVAKLAAESPVLFYGSSIGNLTAEIETLWQSQSYVEMLSGRGFGAWYKDVTGHLSIADPMAYSNEIVGSNQYRRFHLPLIEVLSWTGIVGVLFYGLTARKLWNRVRHGNASALLPLTILLFTLGFLKENQLMFALGLAYALKVGCDLSNVRTAWSSLDEASRAMG